MLYREYLTPRTSLRFSVLIKLKLISHSKFLVPFGFQNNLKHFKAGKKKKKKRRSYQEQTEIHLTFDDKMCLTHQLDSKKGLTARLLSQCPVFPKKAREKLGKTRKNRVR